MFKNKSVAVFCSVVSLGGIASGNLALANKAANAENHRRKNYSQVVRSSASKIASVEKSVNLSGKDVPVTAKAGNTHSKATNEVQDVKSIKNVNIVLIGPPGSGKGTHFETIANKFGLVHYSTGDMLRDEVAKNSEDGKIAKSYMDKGELVPSDIVEKLTRKNLLSSDVGHVIDGSPRSVSEAEFLDKIGLNINAVLYLDVDDNEIIKRVSGRRVCNCGASYHVLYNKPKKDGICDKCGSKLYQRSDDTFNTVKNRLDTFHQQTEPVVEYYEKQGKLVKINGNGSIDEVKQRLMNILEQDENLKKLGKKDRWPRILGLFAM